MQLSHQVSGTSTITKAALDISVITAASEGWNMMLAIRLVTRFELNLFFDVISFRG